MAITTVPWSEAHRSLRAWRSWSQQKAATEIGVSYSLIQKWENEGTEPGFENFLRCQRAYGAENVMRVLSGETLPPEDDATRANLEGWVPLLSDFRRPPALLAA